MPIGPARMPLFDHLGELRRRLTIVVVSVFAATPVVLDILEDPIRSFVPDGKFYITTTLGGFGLRFSLAIKMGAVFCYLIIIPAGFEWLIGETSAVATALPDLENYVNMELLFMIGFGVAYELPLTIARVVITAREGKEGLFVSRLDLFSDDEEDSEE